MKKSVLLGIGAFAVLCFTSSAFAGTISPGDKTSCNNAKSITLEANGNSSKGDRGNANAVIWKSSNFTTVPITLGPSDHNGLDLAKKVGMANKHFMGHKSVTLTGQNNFSRGDSIGDISGEVRITNTGTIPISVQCN